MTDIAVIQLTDATALPDAELGNSDEFQIGDWVLSIGNPYGLGVSVSAGIVSATERHMPSVPRTRLIQTDAATNPGNSYDLTIAGRFALRKVCGIGIMFAESSRLRRPSHANGKSAANSP
jgi:hypothetical protein